MWDEVERAKPPLVSTPITLEELTQYGATALDAPVRTLYEIRVPLQGLADLTEPANETRLVMAGFPLSDFTADYDEGYGLCSRLAQVGEALGWEAILAPSAALLGHGYTVGLLAAGRERIDSYTAIQTGSPTVALAVATRYRDDHKPAWIP